MTAAACGLTKSSARTALLQARRLRWVLSRRLCSSGNSVAGRPRNARHGLPLFGPQATGGQPRPDDECLVATVALLSCAYLSKAMVRRPPDQQAERPSIPCRHSDAATSAAEADIQQRPNQFHASGTYDPVLLQSSYEGAFCRCRHTAGAAGLQSDTFPVQSRCRSFS